MIEAPARLKPAERALLALLARAGSLTVYAITERLGLRSRRSLRSRLCRLKRAGFVSRNQARNGFASLAALGREKIGGAA